MTELEFDNYLQELLEQAPYTEGGSGALYKKTQEPHAGTTSNG